MPNDVVSLYRYIAILFEISEYDGVILLNIARTCEETIAHP
jgi:hypothetical protein